MNGSWADLLADSGTAITDPYQIGALNPLRYRGYYYDTDTQLYYLQSRYYDPEVSRFINADAYASTGQGIVGYNMFAYCNNNPICWKDPTGEWTFNVSLSASVVAFLFGVSGSVGLSVDSDWNFGIQASYALPNYINNDRTYIYGLATAGLGVSAQVTSNDTIYDLEGEGLSAGASAGAGFYGGADLIFDSPSFHEDGKINGMQATMGYGWGLDAHAMQTQTRTLWSTGKKHSGRNPTWLTVPCISKPNSCGRVDRWMNIRMVK